MKGMRGTGPLLPAGLGLHLTSSISAIPCFLFKNRVASSGIPRPRKTPSSTFEAFKSGHSTDALFRASSRYLKCEENMNALFGIITSWLRSLNYYVLNGVIEDTRQPSDT